MPDSTQHSTNHPTKQQHHHHVPTARDIMARKLVTFSPESPIFDAIKALLKHNISGAPVVAADGKVVGILSEVDCLRVLAGGEFYSDDHREEGHVEDYMSPKFRSVQADVDLYGLAQFFTTHPIRRLPVLDGTELIGQVSRRDVLRAIDELGRNRLPKKHYPDYREPASDVGARRS